MVSDPQSARRFLKDKGLSQADIARELGISRQNLHRYLTGRTPPDGFWADFEKAGDKLSRKTHEEFSLCEKRDMLSPENWYGGHVQDTVSRVLNQRSDSRRGF